MILKVINDEYKYDSESLCHVFFPFEKINAAGDGESIVISADENDLGEKIELTVKAELFEKRAHYSQTVEKNCMDYDNERKRLMSICLYNVLCEITSYRPKWGILTGVRPARLFHRIAAGTSEKDAEKYFVDKFLVDSKKADITRRVALAENKIISLSRPDSFSLYISIPFCPSRCSYCSFVSHSVENAGNIIEPYIDNLCREIEITGQIAAQLKLRLESIYFGGGTPTVLSASQLDKIIASVETSFDLSYLREFTVEAGRPDTVTEEKLNVLKKHSVSRISVNPQTFNDDVLEEIGRKHTSLQTRKAFATAVSAGFDNINMDLIAGLPLDTPESFKNSLDSAVELGAQSITVHTLARKRSSFIVTKDLFKEGRDAEQAGEMIDYCVEKLCSAGYYPYYMYRQSKSSGNLENVGWCRDGCECIYNIFMMDETHTVLSCGAGAVTKLRAPHGNKIERIYNYKYPYEYNSGFSEMIKRKSRIKSFYQEYPLERS